MVLEQDRCGNLPIIALKSVDRFNGLSHLNSEGQNGLSEYPIVLARAAVWAFLQEQTQAEKWRFRALPELLPSHDIHDKENWNLEERNSSPEHVMQRLQIVLKILGQMAKKGNLSLA